MKYNITLLLCLFITISAVAQKKSKIKGNKEVADIHNILDDFTTLEIGDGLEVLIQQDENNKYHLEADENLVEVIRLDVSENGHLSIYTTSNITSSKRLNLTLYYNTLTAITIKEDATLETANKVTGDEMIFIATGDSEFKVDFDTKNTTINLNDDAKGEIQLKGEKVTMMLGDKAKIEGSVLTDEMTLTTDGNTDATLSGNMNTIQLNLSDDTDVYVQEIKTDDATVVVSGNAELHVYASSTFNMYAKDKTSVHLYGSPTIVVEGFSDNAKLIKE